MQDSVGIGIVIFNFPPVTTLSQRILRPDDSISADVCGEQNISFTRYRTKYEMDDGDASPQYVQRRGAGGEP
jgi:hypothetical protein